MTHRAKEGHKIHRVAWLRAAVLGANDGIVSTAALMIGFAAAGSGPGPVLLAGVAGTVAGALSMAAGEYVSVSSQSDTEQAALREERAELDDDAHSELRELSAIYMKRGLSAELAHQVAAQLMAHDALDAHARDELGLHDVTQARPLQAAASSALCFSLGAAVPLCAGLSVRGAHAVEIIAACSLASLAVLGAVSARAGGAPVGRAILRVVLWSALAMGVTLGIGRWFGVAV